MWHMAICMVLRDMQGIHSKEELGPDRLSTRPIGCISLEYWNPNLRYLFWKLVISWEMDSQDLGMERNLTKGMLGSIRKECPCSFSYLYNNKIGCEVN